MTENCDFFFKVHLNCNYITSIKSSNSQLQVKFKSKSAKTTWLEFKSKSSSSKSKLLIAEYVAVVKNQYNLNGCMLSFIIHWWITCRTASHKSCSKYNGDLWLCVRYGLAKCHTAWTKHCKCAQWKLKVDLVTNLPKSESKSKSSKKMDGFKSGLEYYKSYVMHM